MGLIASAECSSCGLTAEELFLGAGMSPVFSVVSKMLSYCAKCEALTAEPRFNRPASIRESAKYVSNAEPDDLAVLMDFIARALERACGKCSTKLKDLRYSDSGKPFKCPRCSKKTLRLEQRGICD